MVLVKNFPFFILIYRPIKVFHGVPDKKLAILDDKNIEFKKWQNLHFC